MLQCSVTEMERQDTVKTTAIYSIKAVNRLIVLSVNIPQGDLFEDINLIFFKDEQVVSIS